MVINLERLPRVFPGAENRILFPDDSTPLIDVSRLTVVFHTMAGFLFGSESQFKNNGPGGVRSTWGLGGPWDGPNNNGRLVQWTSSRRQAFAQNDGNPYCLSLEMSDGGDPNRPLSDEMLDTCVKLLVNFGKILGHDAVWRSEKPGQYGTAGYHQQFDVWNTHNHNCPGAVRLTQINRYIIPTANRILSGQGGSFMSYTTAEEQEILKAARQINGAVAPGQTSFSGTIENILSTVQGLVNLSRGQYGTLSDAIADEKSAILAAIAALPVDPNMTEEERQQLVSDIVDGVTEHGITLDPEPVMEALKARLAS